MKTSPVQLTQLLRGWQAGDLGARDELWAIVYARLKRLASQLSRRHGGHERLQTTVLVNELYLRLIGNEKLEWNDRGHFYAIAARAMRYILVDNVRRRQAVKRGRDEVLVSLDEAIEAPAAVDVDLEALHEALEELEGIDPRKCQIVEMSYFAGLTYREIGTALGISPTTVKRDLRSARMWLLHELRREAGLPEVGEGDGED